MQTIYCNHCGSKNIYSGEKPKFCSSCGKNLSLGFGEGKSEKISKAKVVRKASTSDDGDSTDIDYVPDISSLDYTLDSDGSIGYNSFNLGDLVNVQNTEKTQERKAR